MTFNANTFLQCATLVFLLVRSFYGARRKDVTKQTDAIDRLTEKVHTQNNRIGKIEEWKDGEIRKSRRR